MDWTDLIKNPLEEATSFLTDEVKNIASNRLLEYLTYSYKSNSYFKSILNPGVPRLISKYYVPLSVKIKGGDISSLEVHSLEACSLKDLFKINGNIVIVGTAGSGKSTLVKYLFRECIDKSHGIPISIELRQLNNYLNQESLSEKGLKDYIKEELLSFHELAHSESIFDRMLLSGKFVFFLDGFDEVNNIFKSKVINEITKLSDKYNSNNFIVTTRPYSNVEYLNTYNVFEVCPLTNGQIERFINLHFNESETELKLRLLQTVEESQKKHYKTYLKNPLLLTMFVLTFQMYSELPQFRSSYYRQVYDALFNMHDAITKSSFNREKISRLTREQFDTILEQFSYLSYFSQKYVLTPVQIETVFDKIKELNREIHFDDHKLLHDLTISIGILIKDGLDFTYPHRSLQEYFAARYITKLPDSKKDKFYSRVLKKIMPEPLTSFYIENENLLTLIVELDSIAFGERITIPFLEYILNRIEEVNDNIVGSITLINYCKILIPTLTYRHPLIDHAIDKLGYIKMQIVSNKPGYIANAMTIKTIDNTEQEILLDSKNLSVIVKDLLDIMKSYSKEKDSRDDSFLTLI